MNDRGWRTDPHPGQRDEARGETARPREVSRPLLRLQTSLPAVPSSVRVIRHGVADLAAAAGVRGERLDAIRLAVSEAATNVVLHAYSEPEGEMHVLAEVAHDELWVLIADDGHGIRPQSESRGLGLGLALMSEVCDGFSVIDRSGGGTELRLRFSIATEPAAPAPGQERGSVSWASAAPWSTFSTTMYSG